MILERDLYELMERYFEKTVISLQNQDLSELSRQMGAFFLIEKAYNNLATEEELKELYELNGNNASSIHYFSDVIDDFFYLYEQHTKVETIFHPLPRINIALPDSWESDLKTSLDELQKKEYLKVVKSYNWSDYDLELQPKLTIHQKVPYSVICHS